jgi:hypothetical protein
MVESTLRHRHRLRTAGPFARDKGFRAQWAARYFVGSVLLGFLCVTGPIAVADVPRVLPVPAA